MHALARRGLLLGGGAVLGALAANRLHKTGIPERPPFPLSAQMPSGNNVILNDASELNPTRVARHVTLGRDPDAGLVATLRGELRQAVARNRSVSASTARHSMGRQSLAQDGLAITLEQDRIEVDTAARRYRVAAGTRWSAVVPSLDAVGLSPAVMQSNNDFGVAGTFCVNAHGWPVPFGPFGSTVRSLNLMLADGELVTCSRSQESALFQTTMGGYGLTGIITELELEAVPNARLEPDFAVMRAEEFGLRLAESAASDTDVRMAYGRMNVAIDGFLDEAILVTYREAVDQTDLPAADRSRLLGWATRNIFRGQQGSERIKDLRWIVESGVAPTLTGGPTTRNSLLNEPVAVLADGDPARTDILHEYFVPPSRFADFVSACRTIIPSSYQSLLNVTLRYVAADGDSVLAYAPEPRIAAVMLFSQEMTVRAEADMTRMTRALINSALALGGTYYLPYRLHATPEQLAGGYPRLADFVARKRAIDPDLVFRNALWDRYMAAL